METSCDDLTEGFIFLLQRLICWSVSVRNLANFSRIFCRYLDITVSVAQVVGGNEITTPVAEVLDEHQVLIMTPQVLINALKWVNYSAVTTLAVFSSS